MKITGAFPVNECEPGFRSYRQLHLAHTRSEALTSSHSIAVRTPCYDELIAADREYPVIEKKKHRQAQGLALALRVLQCLLIFIIILLYR